MSLFPSSTYLDYNPPWNLSSAGSPELVSNCTSVNSSRDCSPLVKPQNLDCLQTFLPELSEQNHQLDYLDRDLDRGRTEIAAGPSSISGSAVRTNSGSSRARQAIAPADVFNEVILNVFGEEQTILSGSLQSNNAIQAEIIGTTCKRIRHDPNKREDQDSSLSELNFMMSSGQGSSDNNNQRKNGSNTTNNNTSRGLFPPISKSQFDKGKAIPLLPDFSEDPRSRDSRRE
jgi:hypothetical protein